MLELKEITKDYQVADEAITVLKGISLTFRNSEFVSILGPSGCGKTTMLNIIGGLDKFTTGDLVINGKSTKEYKDRDWDTYRNHTIGFVFQSYNLIPHQTILKNVELALSIGGISKKERKQRAIDALVKVGLKDHINKKPNQLSGGQCQRVSIARAIVNDPDVIMADEPTGALDSETSVQVMDILKEISKDRLVIMVTHNAELAQKYSTRIVKMLDGKIIEDSNPVKEKEKIQLIEEVKAKEEKLTEHERKIKEKKASMSLWSIIALSASNLFSKKSRTILTSLACSIGIIGIAVILSVSSGMTAYINKMQEDSTSANYIQISEMSFDTSSILNYLNGEKVELEEFPESTDGIYLYTEEPAFLYKSQVLSDNFVNYLKANTQGNTEETNLAVGLSFSRDIGMHILGKDDNDVYSKIETKDSMGSKTWSELLNNNEYITSQYKIVHGTKMPTAYNEIALVVDNYNRISTQILDSLGITYGQEDKTIDFEKLVGKKFVVCKNDDFYNVIAGGGVDGKDKYEEISTQAEYQQAYENGIELTIVAVIRQDKDAAKKWNSSGIVYTGDLIEQIIETNKTSTILDYQMQEDNKNYDIFKGTVTMSIQKNLRELGAFAKVSEIQIYAKDFDSKDKIVEVLDNWNDSEIYEIYGREKDDDGNYIADAYKVQYFDVSKLLVSMLQRMINITSYVLIAFSAVSLVVSSIMIAIITYTSVIERTKEIGTIRSLGGRKRDVSMLFITEASIIGAMSAIIALVITLIVDMIINLILKILVGVSTIAMLKVLTALGMFALSVGLNLIASLVPANIAAKKDPVVALRTE